MGHVLGIGTLWNSLGLLSGAGTTNPVFTGVQATGWYNQIFALSAAAVPVENTGGPGTRDSHFREATFNNELMTGFLDAGVNPLSLVTVGSLADLGYLVYFGAADLYVKPGGTLEINPPLGTPPVSSAAAPLTHLVTVRPGESKSGLDFGGRLEVGAGFIIEETAGTTSDNEDGSQDSFTVKLAAQPTSNVVLSVVSNSVGELTVDPISLTFTPADWNAHRPSRLQGSTIVKWMGPELSK